MKFLLKILTATLSVWVFSAAGQTSFSKVFYGGGGSGGTSYSGNSLIQGFSSDYYIAGTNDGNGLIAHIDDSGNILWQKKVSSTGQLTFDCVSLCLDSNLVAVGNIYNAGSSKFNGLAVKVDRNGDTLWTLSTGNMDNDEFYSICQNPDSTYFITGTGTMSAAPNSKILLLKISSTGNLLWRKEITAGNNSNYGYAVKSTADSGCVVMAETEYLGGPSSYQGNASLFKFKADGTLEWSKNFYRGNYCLGKDLETGPDGYYLSIGINGEQALAKTDFSGNVLWSKKYPMVQGNTLNEVPSKIHRVAGNNYLLTAGCYSCNGGSNNLFLVDASGNILHAMSIFANAQEAYETADAGYITLGNGPLFGVIAPGSSPGYTPQIGLVRTDSVLTPTGSTTCSSLTSSFTQVDSVIAGSFSPLVVTSGGTNTHLSLSLSNAAMLSFDGCVSYAGTSPELENQLTLAVYPNPSSGDIHLELSRDQSTGLIQLFDLSGRMLLEQKIEALTNNITLHPGKIAPGIYILVFKNGEEQVQQKINIQ